MKEKPSIAARILGFAIVFTIDNLLMLTATVAFCFEQFPMALWFAIWAFYERMTEIRNAIRSNEVQITMSSSVPIRIKEEVQS